MTSPAAELEELAPPAPVAREAAQRVLDYLIFHRSLLDEPDGPPKLLDRYLGLVRNLREGVHVVIDDPFQKATALLFELVMDEEFDPWEIDLVRFTEGYLERVRADGSIDFAVAGRLLYMAWSILYLQSEEVLRHRDLPPEAPLPDDAALLDGGTLEDGEAADPSVAGVLDVPDDIALTPMVRHPESRPVSLLELVQAFGEAEEEARRSLRLEELRGRLREEQRAPPEVRVHGDVPEQDLADAWRATQRYAVGTPFPFLDLWRATEGRDRLVAMFLAVLFLERERALELRQEALLEAPILAVRLVEERAPPPPETPEA